MKALLLTEYKHLEVTDFPEPDVGDADVQIRVRACGICGSDVHGYDGSSGRRIPPLVMGHEAAGVVEQVGRDVTGFRPGDRVTFDSTVYCGECRFCRQHRFNLCDQRMVLGVSCGDYRRHGAFAELVTVPQRIVYKLPDEVPFEHAALIEAVSVAVHAVGRTTVTKDDTALVMGSGMIGLLVIQALRAAGCGRVIAVDLEENRLEAARGFGAETILAPPPAQDGTGDGQPAAGENPVAGRLREMTGGAGADAAFEVIGLGPTLRTAVESVRKGGTIVAVGNLAAEVPLPLQKLVTCELSLLGSCASSGEYPKCIELMSSGAIDVSPLISAQVPLAEGPQWFDRLYRREAGLMKVILQP